MNFRAILRVLLVAFGCLSMAWAGEKASPQRNAGNQEPRVGGPEGPVPISFASPGFVVDDQRIACGAVSAVTAVSRDDGKTLEASFTPIALKNGGRLEVKLFVRWSPGEAVLRKWAEVRLVGVEKPRLLKEVVLDRVAIGGRQVWTHGLRAEDRRIIPSDQSQPVFLPGMFLGVEYPIAATRCEGGDVVLAHRPGKWLQPGAWHTTLTAVYGVAPPGEEVRTFQRYIAAHRPGPNGLHFDYNSWWTAPGPYYTEKQILDLMKVFEEKLFKPHGAAFDSFCIDMGWSEPKSIWEIDAKSFPKGFSRLQAAARRMNANLGLWISPSSCYPTALDGDWAAAHGYETWKTPGRHSLCLGGPHYSTQFKARLAELVGHQGVFHLKLDGYLVTCPKTNHGHEPGDLSAERTADGMIGAMEAARKANPSVWLEPTCFQLNPSPWWVFHANSVLGTFGDDAPAGCVPSPIYRESYTTARDFFNLQGAALLTLPIRAQEVLGIVHQTPEPFMNDAVVTLLRGHQFVPVYVNPAYMNDARWRALARLMQWSRANAAILEETVPLLPAGWQHGGVPCLTDDGTMPREPYGYAHIKKNAGLILLRNPWVTPQSYKLKLDGYAGFSAKANELSLVSVYPEPRRYADGLKHGDAIDVPLMPYETIVLAVQRTSETPKLPRASDAVGKQLAVEDCEHTLEPAAAGKRLTCKAVVRATSPTAELLVLCEGKQKSPALVGGRLTINGTDVTMTMAASDAGWCATGRPHHEHWAFIRAPFTKGKNVISLEQPLGGDCKNVAVYAWATKPGDDGGDPKVLPPPETISLDGATLVPASRP